MSANCKEVILIAEPTFKATPPSYFIGKEQNGCIKPPSSLAATVITEDDKLNNCSKCITVETVEDLDEVRRQVCERPLVLMVTCGKHVPMGQRLNNRGEYLSFRDKEWWFQSDNTPWTNPYANPTWGTGTTSLYGDRWIMPRFVVVINTDHPNIKQQLLDGFDMSCEMIRQGKRFSLEFDFNPMILQWWKNQGPKRYDQIECLTLTSATGARLTVTNATPLRHCCDCHPAWCICWPLYCVIAIPYKVWRNGFQGINDVIVKVDGRLDVAHPESRGYALEDLFEPIAKQPQTFHRL